MRIERAADFSRDLDLTLNAPAGDQSGVEFAQDIRQGQGHEDPVAIVLGSKYIRRSLAQFAKGHFNGAARKLGEHLFQRDSNGSVANIRAANAGLEFQRQSLNNTLQRNFNALAIPVHRGAVTPHLRRLEGRGLGSGRSGRFRYRSR